MLGRLFSGTATPRHSSHPSTRPSTAPESVQEELHTRTLLFPDASLLYHSHSHSYPLAGTSSASWLNPVAPESFDSRGEVDLEFPRDIRLLIAQESTAANSATVLFDTRPAPEAPSSPPQRYRSTRSKSDRGFGEMASMDSTLSSTPRASQPPPSRSSSQSAEKGRGGGRGGVEGQDPASKRPTPTLERASPSASSSGGGGGGGAFQRVHQQRREATPAARMAEAPEDRLAREQREEVKTFLACMFGSASMSYKGTGTKLHIIPPETQPGSSSSATTTPLDGLPPFSRAGSRRSSQLAHSSTPTQLAPIPPASPPTTTTKSRERKTVLITRLFPVPWVDQERYNRGPRTPTSPHALSRQKSTHFPRAGLDQPAAPHAKDGAGRRKTPMYAIALLIHLPTLRARSAPSSRSGPLASFCNTEPFAPFTTSEQAWSPLDPFFAMKSSISDADHGMQHLAQHWDVIMRSLSHLQAVARRAIQQSLRDTDSLSQVPFTKHGPLYIPTTKSQQQMLQLAPGALYGHQMIQREVDKLLARVILGIRIPRVVTGQGRWGVWRDEARVVGRWMESQEQRLYFFTLLTAFLGTHTEWLDSLGPRPYRQLHKQQKQAQSAAKEDLMVQSRTVVISHDKITARRLVFLLAAFFPTSQPLSNPTPDTRPSTPTSSLHGYSQSPPVVGLLRGGDSLRRSISRRGSERLPFQSGARSKLSTSFDDNSSDSARGDLYSTSPNPPPYLSSSRRTSDSSSIRTGNLLLSTNSNGARKVVSVTPATLTPATTVPHFSSMHVDHGGTAPEPRPGSSGSLASINLMHTLKRNDSTNHSTTTSADSPPPSRWGSLLSGFWSTSSGNQRDSSSDITEDSPDVSSADDKPKMSSADGQKRVEAAGKLSRMVAEVDQASKKATDKPVFAQSFGQPAPPRPPFVLAGARFTPGTSPQKGVLPLKATRINRQPTLKVSVNKKDGVIDVDMKLPGFLNPSLFPPFGPVSNASPTPDNNKNKAPRRRRGIPLPCLDPELLVNVAGWLKRFHSDFSLQSVPPYDELENEIKQAMSNEPSPAIFFPSPRPEDVATPTMAPQDAVFDRQLVLEKWVDISTTVIADLSTFTIKRIRLRRLIRVTRAPEEQQPSIPVISLLNAEPTSDELSQTPTQANPIPKPKRMEKEQRPRRASRSRHSQYGNPYPAAPQLSAGDSEPVEQVLEEKFSEELITDMDKVLIAAVDRVIALGDSSGAATAPNPSADSSRSSSSRKGGLANISVPSGGEVPKSECRKLVVKALEEVIASVVAERRLKRRERREKRREKAAAKGRGKGRARRDKGKQPAGGGGSTTNSSSHATEAEKDDDDDDDERGTIRPAPLARSKSFIGMWRKESEASKAAGAAAAESTLRAGVRRWFEEAKVGR